MNLVAMSLYLISNRVQLTDEEAHAIVAYDGIYTGMCGVNNPDY